MSKWTNFWDMHSGGSSKEPYSQIYIEAPQEEATVIFYNRFGHNPSRVTCTCCGEDYSISESESLEQATAFHRHCTGAYFHNVTGERFESKKFLDGPANPSEWNWRYLEEPETHEYAQPYITLQEFLDSGEVLVIRDNEIRDEERVGKVPRQGYIWADEEDESY